MYARQFVALLELFYMYGYRIMEVAVTQISILKRTTTTDATHEETPSCFILYSVFAPRYLLQRSSLHHAEYSRGAHAEKAAVCTQDEHDEAWHVAR